MQCYIVRQQKLRWGDICMPIERRELLQSALPLGAAFFLEAGLKSLAAESGAETPAFDQDTYNFWTSEVTEASQAFKEHGRLVSRRGLNLPNEAVFLYYSKETGFARAASTGNDTPLSRSLLPKGNASLLLSVDAVRPSADYMKKIYDQKNGSLRIDLKQALPLEVLSETLNWSAIASLIPGKQPFGSYREITFDPKSTWGQAKKVPLTGGIGFWSWNFCTQPKPSIWSQVMGALGGRSGSSTDSSDAGRNGDLELGSAKKKKTTAGGGMLGLGFPAIAQTALDGLNQLFGSMLAHGSPKSEWIIHSADTPLLATQEARQRYPGHAVSLNSTAYVVVPADQTEVLLSGKYELNNGAIVPVGTKERELDRMARETLPDVSYIALSAIVEPIA
jgi:hypothetical protein